MNVICDLEIITPVAVFPQEGLFLVGVMPGEHYWHLTSKAQGWETSHSE